MGKRTVIVGDVHGCAEELSALLKQVQFAEGVDQLVLVGDLVGKGPASREVVRLAQDRQAQSVRGNHDEAVLRWRRTPPEEREGLRLGKMHRATAESLGEAEWRYLEAMPLYLRLPGHRAVVVHGGMRPDLPPEEQSERDLLNLRSIKDDGESSYRVDDGQPWASLWPGPELVVFGHDARRGLQQHPFAVGLDTGCVYGGRLTALLLPGRELASVQAGRAYVQPGSGPGVD